MPSALLSQTMIECILSKDKEGLMGEGCIYDLSSSSPTISQPEHLHPGDYVKLRLWLPEEHVCVSVELAEVQWIKNHWINVEVLSASPGDQARLRKFASVEDQSSPSSRRKCDRILIHA
ncbi:MAG: hypothetical protein OEV38_06225 [Nitrospira sp.]|jgi:hypothetical protein|nr:hypothetical protein [Nitrospira sp.]MDH4356330.1 hypothetical protein [Nitrospira sp.]